MSILKLILFNNRATILCEVTLCGYFASVFVKRITKYETLTHYTLFILHSNFVFCWCREKINYRILWHFAKMPPLAWNGAKRKTEKNNAKCEKNDMNYTTLCLSFFTFCEHFMLFCDKCIASLMKLELTWNGDIYAAMICSQQKLLTILIRVEVFYWFHTCQ